MIYFAWGQKKLSVGKLIRINYIYFYSFILSVFVLFSSILWAFTCDFNLVCDTWAKGPKRRQNRTKRAENGKCWWACLGMVWHAASWSCLTQKFESNMPRHDPFMLRHAKVGGMKVFWSHAAAWQNHAMAWRPWLENFIFGNLVLMSK